MAEKFTASIPLILFTTLLPIAIGIEIAATLIGLTAFASKTTLLPALILSFTCTLVSALFVFFHLSHKKRGAKAIRGLPHSLLSREIIFAACFGLLLATSIIYIHQIGITTLLSVTMSVCSGFGLATAVTIGLVYNLPSQIAWRGVVNAAGPFLAVVLMATSAAGYFLNIQDSHQPIFVFIILVLLVESFSLVKGLKLYLFLENNPHLLSYARLKNVVRACYLAKAILLITLLFLALNRLYQTIIYLGGIMILVNRIAFYASAAQQTPEATIGLLKDERMRAALED